MAQKPTESPSQSILPNDAAFRPQLIKVYPHIFSPKTFIMIDTPVKPDIVRNPYEIRSEFFLPLH